MAQYKDARGDAVRGNTFIRDFFDTNLASRNGSFVVGMNPLGTARASAGPLGDIVCAGAFDGNRSDAEVTDILRGMAKLGLARGIAVAGFVP